ncbi:hypothetical protein AC1031_012020 [Aphanomyces cochlioides]|nr:hypothetical protein AC1031_012020 [Aphanomyces cochlioides]
MLSRVAARLIAGQAVRGVAARGLATNAPAAVQRPKHTGPPTLQSTVAEIKYLGTVYSIAASATQLSKEKLEFVVREIKSEKDLTLAREALELYELNYLHIPKHCTGTFVSKCIKNGHADLALDWMANSPSLSKYIVNGTSANLISHYAESGELEKGLKVVDIVKQHKMELSAKVYNALISLCKKQGKMDLAIQFATEACHAKMMNAHGFLLLLDGLSDSELEKTIPLVKSLIHLGEVYTNAKLRELLHEDSAATPAISNAASAEVEDVEEVEADEEEDGDADEEEIEDESADKKQTEDSKQA